MKTFTCKELFGACEMKLSGETMEEVVGKSREHGMEMMKNGDEAHLKVMEEMGKKMEEEGAQEKMMMEMGKMWAERRED